MKWWRVEIGGRVNGRPRDIGMTLQAEDATWAAYGAVGAEWPDFDIDHDYVRGPDGRRVVRFLLDAGDESRVFVTGSETFEEMAREVTGAADVARLEGHPELPLGLEAQ